MYSAIISFWDSMVSVVKYPRLLRLCYEDWKDFDFIVNNIFFKVSFMLAWIEFTRTFWGLFL